MAAPKKKHIRQHSLRGATLTRLSEKCDKRANELWPVDLHKGSIDAMIEAGASKALREFGKILATAGKIEPKLR